MLLSWELRRRFVFVLSSVTLCIYKVSREATEMRQEMLRSWELCRQALGQGGGGEVVQRDYGETVSSVCVCGGGGIT